MDTYDKFRRANAKKRKSRSSINNALKGTNPRTAQILFDLKNRGHGKTTVDKNAAVKALDLVSNLLAKFTLPSKPVLEYHGLVKNATSKDGIISDGVIKIGANLLTLLGHRASIDIPVIVRDKSLLEPAVFFYNEAPYVMCGPALEQLIKSGTLMKDLQPRHMLSPPIDGNGKESTTDKPRTPIMNLHHMYSPGASNPWTFRRYSEKKADEFSKEEFRDTSNSQLERDPTTGKSQTRNPDGSVKEISLKTSFTNPWAKNSQNKEKQPRKRTNIDTPTEMPEIWDDNLPEQHLDQAERTKDGLIPVGSNVTLNEDIEIRERGGMTIVVPSGEKGVVLKDEKGDGQCLYVEFPALGLKDVVYYKYLKKSAATADQVKNEVREMLREGYQKVDIEATVKNRYPEHAEEVLQSL